MKKYLFPKKKASEKKSDKMNASIWRFGERFAWYVLKHMWNQSKV